MGEVPRPSARQRTAEFVSVCIRESALPATASMKSGREKKDTP